MNCIERRSLTVTHPDGRAFYAIRYSAADYAIAEAMARSWLEDVALPLGAQVVLRMASGTGPLLHARTVRASGALVNA